ncbi:MAG TPA: VOC family protein [Rhizomicrobium sp.]
MRFTYAIKYVGDMDQAVRFHRDTLGLPLKFQTPGWSEFATGEVTLALHEATAENPAGSVELGFGVDDVPKTYAERATNGLSFDGAPRELHGMKLATFRDSDGAACSLSSS